MALSKEMLATTWGEFQDLGEFAEQPMQDGRFCVSIDEGRFECLFARGEEPRLFVLLSAARSPVTLPLPKFDRWTWYRMFPGSVLSISDPTLLLDPDHLQIGWYVGTAERDWLRAMAELVRSVAARLNVTSDAIVCYGSSAGGFAAMMLAAELECATAVAINPQTEIGRYSPRFVNRILEAGFGGRSLSELDSGEQIRLSAIERLRRAPAAKCMIVQNLQDHDHYFLHYAPFCEALGVPMEGGACESGRIVSVIFDSPNGHGPEPKEIAPELIRQAVALSNVGGRRAVAMTHEASASLSLRSVQITAEPVWIEVQDGTLAELELDAEIRHWPVDSRSTALVMLELGDGTDPAELKKHGIGLSSSIGPYFYLDHHVSNGILSVKVTIPQGRMSRVGLRLWSWQRAILLENVHLTARGGKLMVKTAAQQIPLFTNVDAEEEILAVDLLELRDGCTPACVAGCKQWHRSMDEYAKNNSSDDFRRTDCFFNLEDSEYAFVSAYHSQPALLAVPQLVDTYYQHIGDKSRNMVRKAQRAGYVYKVVDPNKYIDDIVAIRTSAPLRQGKEIPAYFRERPRQILAEQTCEYHGAAFYGVFKDDRLVAYVTLFLYGQLAQVNHILGHAEHMKNGVMNLLMYEVVNDLIQKRPWIRAINYLYPGNPAAKSGTALFKRSIGFEARRLMVTHGDPDLGALLDTRRRAKAAARLMEAEPTAPIKATPKISPAELGDAMLVEQCDSRARALDFLTEVAGGGIPPLHRFTFTSDGTECASPALQNEAIIVVDGINAQNVVSFLSTGLKQLRSSVTKGSFVLCDFPSVQADSTNAGGNPAVADHGQLEATAKYFKRRFKSTAPTLEAVRDGFKGSDFVLSALAVYSGIPDAAGSSMLLLKKIR